MLRQAKNGLLLDILVSPRAAKTKFGPIHDDRVKIAVTSPPVDGEANEAVVVALAKELSLKAKQIQIVQGLSARRKTIQLEELSDEQSERIAAWLGKLQG